MNSPAEQVLDDFSAGRQSDLAADGHPTGMEEIPPGTSVHATSPSSVADALLAIPVTLQVVIGTARLPVSQIAELRPGAVVNLDQKIGTPVMILINGREVARGDLFVLEGEGARLGITIREVIQTTKRRGPA